jgi:peptidoglycan/LPS O-acetylase OafA/YrhL
MVVAPTSFSTRVAGLDGIRGLAALFVVLHHSFLRSFAGYPRNTGPVWAGFLVYGRFAVVVFIVLSGFSLAVSPARNDWELGGVARFAQRRAWRILPPYWAALVFSLLVAWLIWPQPGTGIPNGTSVAVNALLLQDVIDAPSPNRAFWSIAIEAQLYFVFPLLLLFIRRVSAIAMLITVTTVVAIAGAIAPRVAVFDLMRLEPDFAALFAFGIVAAGIVTASQRYQSLPWHWFAFAAGAPVLAVIAANGSVWTATNFFWIDLALGPAIAFLLTAVATGRPSSLVRVLDTRPLRRLGSFSYSLYLTHAPVVVVVYFEIIDGRVRQGVPSFLLTLAIAVPLTIAFAWCFASVFEIPYLKYRRWDAPFRRRRDHSGRSVVRPLRPDPVDAKPQSFSQTITR